RLASGLDLPDALARQPELLPDLFQRVAASVLQAEAQPQNARLARGERGEQFFYLRPQQVILHALGWGRGGVVLDEGAKLAVLFLADRVLQRERLPAHSPHPLHLPRLEVAHVGDLLWRGVAPARLLTLSGSVLPTRGAERS